MVCYNCDRPGHFARECPNSEDGGRPGWRGSGGGREPSVCYRCDRSGHLARDCPDSADRGSRGGGSVCYRSVLSKASNEVSRRYRNHIKFLVVEITYKHFYI